MELNNAVVFITGANRGLGRVFAEAFLAAGARKVYAAARDPKTVDLPGVVPIALDVTDAAAVRRAVEAAGDVTILVNNAGISLGGGLLQEDSVDRARRELETNFYGPLNLASGFAPVLAKNGGGAIVNVLSALSWVSTPMAATYCVSKAAAWSLTNGLRAELRAQGTQVVGVHVGLMDTDMAKHFDAPKADPRDVVRQVLEAIAEGRDEVLADETARYVKAGLSQENGVYLTAAV
jgi:NAD(P)-dependent dehydrogenase (short-subunit alcohol dehydrogenase family)